MLCIFDKAIVFHEISETSDGADRVSHEEVDGNGSEVKEPFVNAIAFSTPRIISIEEGRQNNNRSEP